MACAPKHCSGLFRQEPEHMWTLRYQTEEDELELNQAEPADVRVLV